VQSRGDTKELLLVGSIPRETSEEVIRWVGDTGLSELVPCVPDGEVGERIYWIPMLSYRLYNGHPDIETLKRPERINGVESWRPKDGKDAWSFRIKSGVKEIHFGDLGWRMGYARDAINSYFVFKTLREKGVIASDVRFQVCLPFTYSGFAAMFSVEDWPIMTAAYEEAMLAELATIVNYIPPGDLAIQWDLCIELAMVENTGLRQQAAATNWQKVGKEPLDLVSGVIGRLGPAVPADAMLGYHLCYGTLGGWPMRHGNDLEMAVRTVDAILELSGRRVDYVHIPILDNASNEYFAPLKGLHAGQTRYYFGVIHNLRNLADFKHKLGHIRNHVSDFGIAAPCGFGRQGILPEVLKEHRTALQVFRETRN
jgi:hypothetical protein